MLFPRSTDILLASLLNPFFKKINLHTARILRAVSHVMQPCRDAAFRHKDVHVNYHVLETHINSFHWMCFDLTRFQWLPAINYPFHDINVLYTIVTCQGIITPFPQSNCYFSVIVFGSVVQLHLGGRISHTSNADVMMLSHIVLAVAMTVR